MQVTKSVTIAGAAEIAGVTEGAIRAAIGRGELPDPTRSACGRAKLLPLTAAEKWANTKRTRGPVAKG